MTLDFNKPIVTRDGRKVKHLHTFNVDLTSMNYPVICVIVGADGKEELQQYTPEGYWLSQNEKDARDLFNVETELYKLVYDNGYVSSSLSATRARTWAMSAASPFAPSATTAPSRSSKRKTAALTSPV
jgi:hypothetical protein